MEKKKNTVEPGRLQMKIRRMRFACWIPKATDTHSDCFSTTTMIARTRLNVALYEGESRSKDKIHLTALIEVTVRDFTYHFST